MLEQNVAYRTPEVAPVGSEGVRVVGVDISFFRGLDIVQSNGRLLVVIEGRQESGFYADVEVLHLWGVQAEILPAQGSYSYQLHLALENVDEHGQFVKPSFAQKLSPTVYAVIVSELATVLEALMLKHIRLEVLRI